MAQAAADAAAVSKSYTRQGFRNVDPPGKTELAGMVAMIDYRCWELMPAIISVRGCFAGLSSSNLSRVFWPRLPVRVSSQFVCGSLSGMGSRISSTQPAAHPNDWGYVLERTDVIRALGRAQIQDTISRQGRLPPPRPCRHPP